MTRGSGSEVRFVRRNRVDERFAGAIAVAAALVSLLSPASPTGSAITDGIVLVVSVGCVVWASASAPWWAVAGAGGIAAAIAFTPIVAVLGFLAFLAGLHVGIFRRDDGHVRSIAGGVAVNALLWSQLDGFFGASAIIGITTCALLLIVGIRRRPSRVRRPAWQMIAGVGVLVLLAGVGVAVAATGSRSDVTAAAGTARDAVGLLNRGDYESAADMFEESATGFDRGASGLGGPIAYPGRVVPGVAQNLEAGRVLSEVAAGATADAAAALRSVDPSELTLSNGRIDPVAIAAVEAPLTDVQASLVALESGSQRVQSPWLVGPIQSQLDRLEEEIDDNEPRLQNAVDAVRFAPDLLGAGGERRYLILFTSPAEARGAAGFFGNWAELTATDGRLVVERSGRTGELNDALRENGSDCDGCPEEFLAGYGQYGFTTGPDGTVGPVAWSNITMPAHFPYAAQAIASLYPDSGGRPLDGVIAMDPYVLAQLMQYTGPIEVPELDVSVAAADAAEFLLVDQYSLADEKDVRVEALDTLGNEAIRRLLTSELPDPPELARDFGPLVEEGRLLMWTTDPAERAFLDRIGMLGALPAIDSVDGGFGVDVTNASSNKIDSFLTRDVSVEIERGADGERRLVADVTLTNNAPTTGFPDYVIGNPIDLPVGTSRLIVTFYGPPLTDGVKRDGERIDVATLSEAGWLGYRTVVELEAGGTVNYRLTFAIPPDDDDMDEPVTWTQALRK